MSRMSCRECHFIKVSVKNVDSLVEKVKLAVAETGVPRGYEMNVYKNVYACCGVGDISLIIEVIGPEDNLRAIDLKAVSKVLEICEKESLEHHMLEPLEII